jgi:hypothetical protein
LISIVFDWLNHERGGSGTASGDGGEVNRAPAKCSFFTRGVSEPDEDEKDPFLLRAGVRRPPDLFENESRRVRPFGLPREGVEL